MSILVPVISLMFLAGTTTKPDDPNNAATFYYKAFAEFPSGPSTRILEESPDRVRMDPTVENLIAEANASLIDLHNGAKLLACDWGVDVSDDPFPDLSYPSSAVTLSRLADLRARMEFTDGDSLAAVDDLCDCLVLSRQTGGVLDKIEHTSVLFLSAHLESLDKPSMDELAARLRNLLPITSAADVVKSGNHPITVLIAKLHAAQPSDTPASVFAAAFQAMPADNFTRITDAITASGNTTSGVIQQLQALLPYYDKIADLAAQSPSLDDFKTKGDAILAQFDNNPFHFLLTHYFPGFITIYERQSTEIVMLQAGMAIVPTSPDAVKNFSDPINHQPLNYVQTNNGFRLECSVPLGKTGKTISLEFGK